VPRNGGVGECRLDDAPAFYVRIPFQSGQAVTEQPPLGLRLQRPSDEDSGYSGQDLAGELRVIDEVHRLRADPEDDEVVAAKYAVQRLERTAEEPRHAPERKANHGGVRGHRRRHYFAPTVSFLAGSGAPS
jgi:hypothetical protein